MMEKLFLCDEVFASPNGLRFIAPPPIAGCVLQQILALKNARVLLGAVGVGCKRPLSTRVSATSNIIPGSTFLAVTSAFRIGVCLPVGIAQTGSALRCLMWRSNYRGRLRNSLQSTRADRSYCYE